MSSYQEYGIHLSISQFKKILTAGKNKTSVTIRIMKKNLQGDHKLLLTKTQINRLNKSTSGLDLTLSKLQVNRILKVLNIYKKDMKRKQVGFFLY